MIGTQFAITEYTSETGKGKSTFVLVNKSRYLLTGKNLFNKNLFMCTNCGGGMMGYPMKASKKQGHKIYYKYICSNFFRKGKNACNRPKYINKEWIEYWVIEEIDKRYNSIEAINEIIKRLNKSKENENEEIESKLKYINKEIRKTKNNIDALFEAIYSGANKNLIAPKSEELYKKIKELESKRNSILSEKKVSSNIDISAIQKFFIDFKNIISHGTNEQKKNIIKSYVNRILYNPIKDEFTIEFFELLQDKITITSKGSGTRVWHFAINHVSKKMKQLTRV